jgi:hypothetical protein
MPVQVILNIYLKDGTESIYGIQRKNHKIVRITDLAKMSGETKVKQREI